MQDLETLTIFQLIGLVWFLFLLPILAAVFAFRDTDPRKGE